MTEAIMFIAGLGEAILEQIVLQPAFLGVVSVLALGNLVGFKVVNN